MVLQFATYSRWVRKRGESPSSSEFGREAIARSKGAKRMPKVHNHFYCRQNRNVFHRVVVSASLCVELSRTPHFFMMLLLFSLSPLSLRVSLVAPPRASPVPSLYFTCWMRKKSCRHSSCNSLIFAINATRIIRLRWDCFVSRLRLPSPGLIYLPFEHFHFCSLQPRTALNLNGASPKNDNGKWSQMWID